MEPRKLLPLLAMAGILIVLHQSMDLVPATAGLDLATPTGRVQVVTVVWSRSAALLLADIFLIGAAVGLGQSRSLAGLARVHLVLGILVLLAVPFLLQSAGGVANTISGAGVGVFRVTIARLLLGLALLGSGALAAWRALWAARVTAAL